MNYSFVFRQLSAVCVLLGGLMFFSIPWASPALGGDWKHEASGVFGLCCSIGLSFLMAFVLWRLDRYIDKNNSDTPQKNSFSKKEATAVVGLTWVLATVLGAMPYLCAGVERQEGTPMSVCDALFESQSGFSTTGATVFAELERPDLLPRCILFWRGTTHFLGGLGIMVLFVVLLGYGTGTKKIVRSEMTGPGKWNPKDRVQQLTKVVFSLYVGMVALQTIMLFALGLSLFDALCHAFSTVATGGFSTFNASAGHFAASGYEHAAAIEWTLILFMFLGGTNFILLYWVCVGKPGKLLRDTEWRTYVGIILIASTVILIAGLFDKDFDNYGTADTPFYVSQQPQPDDKLEQFNELSKAEIFSEKTPDGNQTLDSPKNSWLDKKFSEPKNPPREEIPVLLAFRVTVFQVVSMLTTTGLCSDEYEKWSGLCCGTILLLMFLGGCAGSTSGGFKIIRAICLAKSLPQEIELSYRPNVVRPLFIGGEPIERETIRHIMFHFVLLTTVFIAGTLLVLLWEPATTWGGWPVAGDRKLVDTASAVAACLNNIGPGIGLIGARDNFGVFSEASKFVFTWLMMLGRLELFVVLSMFHPGFWRR